MLQQKPALYYSIVSIIDATTDDELNAVASPTFVRMMSILLSAWMLIGFR